MRKTHALLRNIFAIVLLLMLVLQLPTQQVEAASVKLSRSKLTLTEGKTKTLKVNNLPAKYIVKWRSTDKSIASVNTKGKITARSEGSCTIKAVIYKANGSKFKTLQCKLKVNAAVQKAGNEKDNKNVADAFKVNYVIVHNAAEDFDGQGIFVNGDGYGYIKGSTTINEETTSVNGPLSDTTKVNLSSGVITYTAVLSLTREPSSGEIKVGFYNGKTELYDLGVMKVTTGDVITFTATIDCAAWIKSFGADTFKLQFSTVSKVTLTTSNGEKLSYDDIDKLIELELVTAEAGGIFRFTSDKNYTYSYVAGQTYAVTYNFILEAGPKSGKYSIVFPYDGGSDTQSFSVDANSVYAITYTYGIDFNKTMEYTYDFDVTLSGTEDALISLSSTHPGKMTKGNFSIKKTN